ncbi:MAG TPA: class I SAM-dependent methyltransferase [bacterium]|nr:class I SAM-dependent methyltransferase [bacterium]
MAEKKNIPTDSWTDKKARWFQEAISYSTFPENAVNAILPYLKDSVDILDIGAGVGALAIPLASKGFKISAVEPSVNMADILQEQAEKTGNKSLIRIIRTRWEETSVVQHDAVIASNLPPGMLSNKETLVSVFNSAKRNVFIIKGTGSGPNKFFYEDLYPLIFRKQWIRKDDSAEIYGNLREMGITPDTKIISHRFDQRFEDMVEAVEFWKEHMKVTNDSHDDLLSDYLAGKLKKIDGGQLLLEVERKSEIIICNK